MMTRFLPMLIVALVLGMPLQVAAAAQSAEPEGFSFMVLADTAYGDEADAPALHRLIEGVNTAAPAFTLHLGDIFGGNVECSDARYMRVRQDFALFAHPVVYTPGDNEWTDCASGAKAKADPLGRLERLRHIFYARPVPGDEALGIRRQDDGLAENAVWQKAGVVFATLHIVGSNNGLVSDSAGPRATEYRHRNQANLAWLDAVFARAEENGARAVVLAFHADMFGAAAEPDGFADLRGRIETLSSAFDRPVLLLHGDSHVFIIDRPYWSYEKRARTEKIIRLQTYGWPDAKAVRVRVRPGGDRIFAFEPFYVGEGLYPTSP